MGRRFVLLVTLAAAVMVVTASAASAAALDQVSGQGQTPLSASLGFNADSSGQGELNYNADPNGPDAGFSAHCKSYASFQLKYNADGNPQVNLKARDCTDQDGVTVYMKGGFVDAGEPGTYDWLCIAWSYTWPIREHNAFIHDMGYIQNGNIQIHDR